MLRAQICDLLLVLAHGDAAVKAALTRPGTLRALCAAAARLPAPAQVKCLKCLKHLSGDPGMLEPMQARAPACCAAAFRAFGSPVIPLHCVLACNAAHLVELCWPIARASGSRGAHRGPGELGKCIGGGCVIVLIMHRS